MDAAKIRTIVCLLAACWATHAGAQRLPVLGQIDLPHPYYFREMYLPQLTGGPSSVAWSPDGSEVVFSMAGSLWRQAVGGGPARQLTADAAYDYQPDWSPDGRWIVYTSYRGGALELWTLNTGSGVSRQLTHEGAVNVEPRFAPDGRRLVFVSTRFNGRFHVFTADFAAGALSKVGRITGENKSPLPRYYYSAFDTEISPVWTRDGRDILYVSNRNHIYGTGGFWRVAAAAGAPATEIHYEETNWKARPDISPDGSRVVFSSYLGRSWHNLWVMPTAGGDAFPLGYGDWDQTNARWSPDGTRVAFISNRDGNTELCIEAVPGGTVQTLNIDERRYLKGMTQLRLNLKDGKGGARFARVSVTGADGRFYAPAGAWIHGDDGYDRHQRPFEAHYFHAHGAVTLEVPVGTLQVDIVNGFERRLERHEITTVQDHSAVLDVDLDEQRLAVPDDGHWVSGDGHVHMNYGGVYRNTPAHLLEQARAENLSVVQSLIVNKEQRFPDIAYSGAPQDPASPADTLVVHGQEYHTSYWGHLALPNIAQGVILPGYAGYPNTAASSLYPMNADIADIAHARGALVGYAHPFDEYPEPLAKPAQALTNELPIDVALGKIDYLEVLGFSDHRSTAQVWYQLLNLGFRIPAGAGTDAMANFASLRGPVGMNRVYVKVPGEAIEQGAWLQGLKAGRTFATNGPLLGFTLGDASIGDELKLKSTRDTLDYSVRLRSFVAVDHLELVCNGRVVRSFLKRGSATQADIVGKLALRDSGWCVVRASSAGAVYPTLDNYVYATTSPIYVSVGGQRPRSPADARYFVAWVERVMESTTAYPDWNDAAERRGVLERLERAKAVFTELEQH